MRAIQLSRFGGPDVLECVELPKPVAGRGEILVKVEAAGVNFFETLLRADRYAVTPELAMILGVEAVGVVAALGEEVTAPVMGTRVAAPLFATDWRLADMPTTLRSMQSGPFRCRRASRLRLQRPSWCKG
jgi:NADPH2:quinone reductase